AVSVRGVPALGRGLSIALAVLVALGGCTHAAASRAPSYALGLDLPLSGIDGASAIPARNGALLAVEQADARGFPGGATVVLDDLDDSVEGKHDPAQGALNLRTLVADPRVFAVVGPLNSNVASAEIPIAAAANLALLTPAASAVELTAGPRTTFYRLCATDDRQGAALAAYVRGLGLQNAFVIDDDESYGRGLADAFVAAWTKVGGRVLGRDHLVPFESDFVPLLTKVRALGPGFVFFGGIVSTGGAVLRRQMADAGLGRTPYVGGDGLASPDYVPLAGSEADGTIFSLIGPDVRREPAARGFLAAYRRRFGTAPADYSAPAYAAAAVALAALRAVLARYPDRPPARAEVLARIAGTDGLPTPIGPIRFDPSGNLAGAAISIYRIEGGGRARFAGIRR
ncbi:MAG: branched-chain amino acid ABC transporter substrate-binding protein, partial [Vulcanimicrobiaceae bacterium]